MAAEAGTRARPTMPRTRAQLGEAVLASARCWRLGMEAAGSELLVAVVDALLAGVGGKLPAAAASLLGELLAAQQRGDAIGLADRMEGELAPLFAARGSGVGAGR